MNVIFCSTRVTPFVLSLTLLGAAQLRIANLVAMHACTTHSVRQDRGALGKKPSALVAVVGVGPEGPLYLVW